MEKASIWFSAGKRICLGQHLAWIEMKKLVAELVVEFEVCFVTCLFAWSSLSVKWS